jgi:hypothetical protein
MASAILCIIAQFAFAAGFFMPGSMRTVSGNAAPDRLWTPVGSFVGSEGPPRTFYILVDDDTIAAQSLGIHPTKGFDFGCKLPERLKRGEQKITVKFLAPANAYVGQVLDVRVAQQ